MNLDRTTNERRHIQNTVMRTTQKCSTDNLLHRLKIIVILVLEIVSGIMVINNSPFLPMNILARFYSAAFKIWTPSNAVT
jgi:DUF1365 family protein